MTDPAGVPDQDTGSSAPLAQSTQAKRMSMSRLPVLRKVSASIQPGPASPSSPVTSSARSRMPALRTTGLPSIPKRSTSTRIGGTRNVSGVLGGGKEGTTGPGFTGPTSSSAAKVVRKSPSSEITPLLKTRASTSSLQAKISNPELVRKASASQLHQSSSRPSLTPKGRRTSDINGIVAPPLNRRASNTSLKQPETVTRRTSNPQLARKASVTALGPPADSSPTPLRRASSSELPKTPRTPTLAKSVARAPQVGPRLATRPLKPPQIESASAPVPVASPPKKAPGAHRAASQSLRETIAAARKAAKAANSPAKGGISLGTNGNGLDGFDFGTNDQFNEAIFGEGGSKKALLKRVKAARFEGKLNISAMQLKEVPPEVYKMYETTEEELVEASNSNDDGPKWYESVDLVRILMADNEIEELGEELAKQFGALATIDMHNNVLKRLPRNLTELTELTVLNLNNNKLGNDDLEVLFQISTLKDLKLGRNNFTGDLDGSLSNLVHLEVLELQENELTSLPSSISELPRLRVLNVSKNKLESLPLDSMKHCQLQELTASHNKLSGTLFPASADGFTSLQTLSVNTNRLTAFSEAPILFPALTQFIASNNQLSEFPTLAGWDNLLILLLDENKISSLPEDMFSLKRLRTLDFSGNDIKAFDARLGTMDSLEVIKFSGNPLRDRALAGMSGPDLKKALRARLAPPEIVIATAENDGRAEDGPLVNGEAEDKRIELARGGVLDLSNKGYSTLEESVTTNVNGTPKTLLLTHNALTAIPPTAASFASTLVMLDISFNRFSSEYLSAPISFRVLETLGLANTSLTSLDPLYQHLQAPKLQTLDVSANRITSIEGLRQTLPTLLNFHARDNAIGEIPVESVDGLRTLDLSGNSIATLPPRLALCEGLRELKVQGNLFRVPRWQVLEKGTDAVLAWLRDRLPVEDEQ